MIENLQIHVADIQAPNPAKGSSGAEKDAYATVVYGMPCRVITPSATWSVLYAQRKENLTHQVYTNQNPGIKPGYQVIWQGRTLRVLGARTLGGTIEVTQIDCQELL
jgi:hypothetical protein